MMRYLAVCGSVKTFELLLRNKSSAGVLTTVDEDGMTLLHFATLSLTSELNIFIYSAFISLDIAILLELSNE